MTQSALPDPGTPFGERVHRRLADEQIIWLTTVGKDGTPQPNPIWFVHEDDHVLVYNGGGVKRIAHIAANPRVALNLDGDGKGSDIVVITGTARVVDDVPAPHENPAFVAKYRAGMERMYGTIEHFTETHPVAIRIDFGKVRGF
ncbi:MAG TPA: TIGR03667 family PPOX class F420-dependent oxidoreductase [Pseudonocardiaceae bacterium]|jgi:PPOX class probable F420-dependent enzyme|nr:TIGR03667 family PPOX class F420-dependent oxidoreductase [Pseudonocardiaceae bacterium]